LALRPLRLARKNPHHVPHLQRLCDVADLLHRVASDHQGPEVGDAAADQVPAGVAVRVMAERNMRIRPRQLAFTVASPLLSIGLLAGIVSEQRTHLTPQAVEPFHERAKAGAANVPYVIGYWTGKDEELAIAALKLLRPNALLLRT